jgi:hypothetical protein
VSAVRYRFEDADAAHPSGQDRYAVYVVRGGERRRLAETSLEGIGVTLRTLRDEGEFDEDAASVGIFDRQARSWLLDPFKGRGWPHL